MTADSCIAAARGGTLFLQDVADLPAGVQARLARVIRDGEVRIDGTTVETGFRLVASATMNLEPDVDATSFPCGFVSDASRACASISHLSESVRKTSLRSRHDCSTSSVRAAA